MLFHPFCAPKTLWIIRLAVNQEKNLLISLKAFVVISVIQFGHFHSAAGGYIHRFIPSGIHTAFSNLRLQNSKSPDIIPPAGYETAGIIYRITSGRLRLIILFR